MIITVQSAGRTRPVDADDYGSPSTIGQLFGNAQFREDLVVPDRAVPLFNGQAVDGATPLNEEGVVSYQIAASSKSA
tara:strand:- start:18906 stop:19136 length:231 start_codon:yes stop_codon:yes gene_type:complete